MTYYFLTNEKLGILISELIKQDYNVVCESKTGKKFEKIAGADELYLKSGNRPTKVSVKEYFFPKTEPLFFYKKDIENVDLIDPVKDNRETVFVGIKPCDAAAIPILGKVFNWDYKDDFFNERVEHSVVIGMACSYMDDNCFCTSVGLSPESEKGSDLFMHEYNEGFALKSVTEKGEAFLNKFSFLKEKEIKDFNPEHKNNPPKRFEYDGVKEWLDNNFMSEFWNGPGELCLGCAQCAYVCPTCHCFDIVDEECGLNCGRRVKNWDACQFGLFTKHASGHNPRENQEKRYRQRVSHKFKYYQDRFGEILCTGCGRCIRGCPVFVDISEILSEINSLQKKAAV